MALLIRLIFGPFHPAQNGPNHPTLTELSAKLGLPTSGSKEMLFEKIKEQLAATFTQSGRTPIFVIDEAQFLRQAVLDDLRMLTNFEIDSKNYFVLILSGEPRLVSTLLTPVNEALRQRIVVHYSFAGLSDEEAGKLIVHKIQSAGGAASIIDPAATNAVITAAHGNSRRLDRIMSQAILIGAQNKKTAIDTDTIEASVMQLKLQGGLNVLRKIIVPGIGNKIPHFQKGKSPKSERDML